MIPWLVVLLVGAMVQHAAAEPAVWVVEKGAARVFQHRATSEQHRISFLPDLKAALWRETPDQAAMSMS